MMLNSRSYTLFPLFLTSVKLCISPVGDCGSDLCQDSRTVNIIHLAETKDFNSNFFIVHCSFAVHSLLYFLYIVIHTYVCIFIYIH